VDLLQLLILLVVAGLCGAVAEWIIGYNPGGLLVAIIIGVIGAYIGNWIGGLLPLDLPLTVQVDSVTFNLIWAVIGSLILLVLIRTIRGGARWNEIGRGLLGRR
jgi:uncharacterized membrane protein YeaQ/YmgE (transglycosylase-associated protein family)